MLQLIFGDKKVYSLEQLLPSLAVNALKTVYKFKSSNQNQESSELSLRIQNE